MENSVEMIAAQMIREEREAQGMSQGDLSRALVDEVGMELNQSTISKIEAGTRSIRVNELFAIAEALGVSVTSLTLMPPSKSLREAIRASGEASRALKEAAEQYVTYSHALTEKIRDIR
jgi:transcriptional regulator with XRE-family HTH domain